jgi:hypothetical protein
LTDLYSAELKNNCGIREKSKIIAAITPINTVAQAIFYKRYKEEKRA